MKLIIAVIRTERTEATKKALMAAGIRGATFIHVTGRGQQKGRISTREMGEAMNRNLRMQLTCARIPGPALQDGTVLPDARGSFGFLPKRMLFLVTGDDDVSRITQAIVDANQTGRHGDGRIFICPMISAVRVRTGEQGDRAIG